MAMTTRLWTLNALSLELGISSRVLDKRLSGLTPDAEEQQDGRQMKSWRLARVLRHLKAAGPRGTREGVDERLIEDHKHVVTEYLFPALTGSRYFLGFFLAYLHEDVGLTKPQALQAYGAVVIALHHALGEFFASVDAQVAGEPLPEDIEAHGLEVRIPTELRKLCDLGPEAYAAKYWPAPNGLPGPKRTQ
jgi:hypothetical protein